MRHACGYGSNRDRATKSGDYRRRTSPDGVGTLRASSLTSETFDRDTVPGGHWLCVSDVPLVVAVLAFIPHRAAVMRDLETTNETVAGALRAERGEG